MDFVGCTGVTGVTAELSGFSGAFGSFGGSLDTAPSLSTRKVPSASTLAASFIGCPFPSASELLFPFGRLRIAASLGGTRCTGYGVSSTLFTAAAGAQYERSGKHNGGAGSDFTGVRGGGIHSRILQVDVSMSFFNHKVIQTFVSPVK